MTIKEKNCLLSDLDWQLTSKDYTINLLQKDRERQGVSVGVSVGVSAPIDIPPRQGGALSVMGNGPYDSTHGNMLSPTAVLTASDEYQHVRCVCMSPYVSCLHVTACCLHVTICMLVMYACHCMLVVCMSLHMLVVLTC